MEHDRASGDPIELLEELLDVRDRDVLDVGCGEGLLVRRLASAGARVVGLDPSAVALERAHRAEPAGTSTRFVEGTAEALPFLDASLDAVVFFNSLHHVPLESMDAALAEAARVLRPNGVLYVQEPLAEGSFFELMVLVDDETRVRSAAQEALRRALVRDFVELDRRDVLFSVRHDDFEAFRNQMLTVEPARAAAFEEHQAALHTSFARLGQEVEGGGHEFEQPFRINLFGLDSAM
jgi:ubiquinone/menaquinone biosynthesis C-methylase UbiE